MGESQRAKANGREPFEKRPDVSALDPMKEELWTLPMAAAWFIWRSPQAVRDQWNLARKSWTKWIQITDRLHKVPPRPNRRLWDLKLFRRAHLDDVFAQAGFNPWKNSQFGFGRRSGGRGSNREADNPYDRFKASLKSGKLIATRMRPGEQEGAQIPAEYWIAEFEEFEHPLDFDLPGSSSAHDTPSEKPFESPFAVDLSEHLEWGIERLEIPESFFDDPPEGDIYVRCVSPAHAGMVPRPPASWWRRLSLPRPRGDGPEIASDPAAAKGSPPPTRGWSPDGKVARRQARVSPAHAGMVLSARRRPVTDNRLPRPRGDGPGPPLIRYGLGKSPPPTRGWSLISPELRSADRVSPAHAGMVPFGNIALATGQVLEGRRKM